MSNRNQSGFSLLEMMVTVAISAVLLFAITDILVTVTRSQETSNFRLEQTTLRYEMSLTLDNPVPCNQVMRGLPAVNGTPVVISKDSMGSPIIGTGGTYGILSIASLTLQDVTEIPPLGNGDYSANLVATGTLVGGNYKLLRMFDTGDFKISEKFLFNTDSSGNIVGCYQVDPPICSQIGWVWVNNHCDPCASIGGTLQPDGTCRLPPNSTTTTTLAAATTTTTILGVTTTTAVSSGPALACICELEAHHATQVVFVQPAGGGCPGGADPSTAGPMPAGVCYYETGGITTGGYHVVQQIACTDPTAAYTSAASGCDVRGGPTTTTLPGSCGWQFTSSNGGQDPAGQCGGCPGGPQSNCTIISDWTGTYNAPVGIGSVTALCDAAHDGQGASGYSCQWTPTSTWYTESYACVCAGGSTTTTLGTTTTTLASGTCPAGTFATYTAMTAAQVASANPVSFTPSPSCPIINGIVTGPLVPIVGAAASADTMTLPSSNSCPKLINIVGSSTLQAECTAIGWVGTLTIGAPTPSSNSFLMAP